MANALSLSGERVVVIGGASGIGRAVAALAREAGAAVVIASRDAARVEAAASRIGAEARTVDLRDEVSVKALFASVGAFDHLAITAGDWTGALLGPADGIDTAAAKGGFEVRFWGAANAVKHALGSISPTGSITLTSGIQTQRPRKGAAFVAALGGATEALVRGLAVDVAPVRVNAVSPGLILTEQVARLVAGREGEYTTGLPLPRGGTPDEAAVAYVGAMLSRYMTGQVIAVDGGGSAA